MHDKEEYFINIRNLKTALSYEFILKNVYRVIKFNQKVWLKPYNDINRTKKGKNDFEEDFKLMNNAVLEKSMEKCDERNYLVSELIGIIQQNFFLKIYYTYKLKKKKKTQIFMNKTIYLGLYEKE